jgi:arginine exporter protein ArgO
VSTQGPLLAGAVAGIGVALPLGAIGVLLLQEGLVRGWRSGVAAATGVALVDLTYAWVAVLAGTAVTRALAGHERTVQVVGAGVLVVVAARGLLALRTAAGPLPAGALSGGPPSADVPSGHVLLRFVALTAVNPLTAVYFVVLTAGLGSVVAGPGAGTAFVTGVFLASWAWQLVLACTGALAGARMPSWARTATTVAGYVVVLGYAARLALGA